jgi:hypothetical protein
VLDSSARDAAAPAPPQAQSRRRLLTDAAVVVGVLLVLGVVAGLVWPSLGHPVELVRTASGVSGDEVQLGRQFDDEGWYVVLAAVFGGVAGLGLTLWRDRRGSTDRSGDPIVTVLLLLVGSCLAAWVMKEVGTALGPPPVEDVLAHAKVGATAPGPLEVRTKAAYLVWPIATLVGAAVVLWTRQGSQPAE